MPRENTSKMPEHHDLLSGLIRLHVLHHASEQDIYGQWMIDELAGHGYRLSPGTLYPMLHAMERRGCLVSRVEKDGKVTRKHYRVTTKGLEGLVVDKERLRELMGETMPEHAEVRKQGAPETG